MDYILKDEIKITRPILFLCGPYYDKNNANDRRRLLQEAIYNIHSNKYLPLVIDDFLTAENINDENVSIQLMEEICAAISAQTYIFLDTLSAATELGIFANSAYFNKIKVFIPKPSDISNKSNVGYFVRDVVLEKHKDRVEAIEYRPGIERKAIATDYIVEHYNFVNNVLPDNIQKTITDDGIFSESDIHKIKLIESSSVLSDPYDIHYKVNGDILEVNISIKLLFYTTVSLLYCDYKKEFRNRNLDFSTFNLNKIIQGVKGVFFNYIENKTKIGAMDIDIDTALKFDFEKIVYHIVKFVHVYCRYSSFHSQFLLTNPIGKIIEEIKGERPQTIFDLSKEQITLLKRVRKNKALYFDRVVISKGKKKRELITYKNNEDGCKLRDVHEHIQRMLNERYISNYNSYAYQKGKSIKTCAEKHLEGKGFVKFDIKKFFNSISYDKMKKVIISFFSIDDTFAEDVDIILESCFYDNRLPLGLVLSPIFSDMYMRDVDNNISMALKPLNVTYTRYADDMMFSSREFFSEEEQAKIERVVVSELKGVGLNLNEEKSQYINFDEAHGFVKYIGVNIVKGDKNNYLSLGKKYIYEVAKEYLKYKELYGKEAFVDMYTDSEIFYTRQRLIGKIGFIKHIEGDKGLDKLNKRLAKHSMEIDKI